MWVVGLGNSGRRYAGTRHNVGQAVVLALVERWRAQPAASAPTFRAWRGRPAGAAGGDEVALVVPLAFMNRSGEALADFEARTGARVAPADALVVCDDVYLPVGQLRVRPSGSTGGHRGLASIETRFGTADYPRLRVGVGAASGEDLADHVLSRFSASEEEAVREALVRAGDAVETWVREGVLAAMNRFNRRVREVSP